MMQVLVLAAVVWCSAVGVVIANHGSAETYPVKITIKRAPPGEMNGYESNVGPDAKFRTFPASLDRIIAFAWDVRLQLLRTKLPLSKRFYHVTATAEWGHGHELRPALQKELQKKLGVKVRRENRTIHVLVLTAPNGVDETKLKPDPAANAPGGVPGGTVTARQNSFEYLRQSFKSFLGSLEWGTKYPVLNEAGIEGDYSFTLNCDQRDVKELIEAMENDLGLKLTLTTREMEVIIVEKAGGVD